ncbi:hypothetical protein C8R45DRAFT_1096044 [Mycena sanguinolenta]|nr:hypothetical protein C8R45DRAFT_1096044 [Mycena sanguinolenta]
MAAFHLLDGCTLELKCTIMIQHPSNSNIYKLHLEPRVILSTTLELERLQTNLTTTDINSPAQVLDSSLRTLEGMTNVAPHLHNHVAHQVTCRTSSRIRRDALELEWHEGT